MKTESSPTRNGRRERVHIGQKIKINGFPCTIVHIDRRRKQSVKLRFEFWVDEKGLE
jgi:hypothetical protein